MKTQNNKTQKAFSTAQILQILFALIFFFYFLGHALIAVGA